MTGQITFGTNHPMSGASTSGVASGNILDGVQNGSLNSTIRVISMSPMENQAILNTLRIVAVYYSVYFACFAKAPQDPSG